MISKKEYKEYFKPRMNFINSSVGCYWKKCTYCNHQKLLSQFIKPPKKVVDDIEDSMNKLHALSIDLNTDCLKEIDSIALCEEIIKRGLNEKIRILMYCRPDVFSKDYFKKIKLAGINRLAIGVESFSNRILRTMRKGTNLKNIINCIKSAHNENIYIQINLIYDFPTTTREDIKKNIDTLYEICEYIDNLVCFSFELYYNTNIYSNLEKYNISLANEDKKKHYINKIPFRSKKNIINENYLFLLELFKKYVNNNYQIKKNIAIYKHSLANNKALNFKLCDFIINVSEKKFIYKKNETLQGTIINNRIINYLKTLKKNKEFVNINLSNANYDILNFFQFCIRENIIYLYNENINGNDYKKIIFKEYESFFKNIYNPQISEVISEK